MHEVCRVYDVYISIYIYTLWAPPLRPAPDLCTLGLQILGIIASGSWHFLVHHLAIFASLIFWDTREYNKRHFEVQAWISIDFWRILLPMVAIWLLGASTLAS